MSVWHSLFEVKTKTIKKEFNQILRFVNTYARITNRKKVDVVCFYKEK